MYEMKVGLASGGGELVWHVVSRHRHDSSLCGTSLATAASAGHDTDRHCASCMLRLQELLDAARH
ncbi:hypothetical protein [Streptomyces aurantiogriseus]|uniref:Uncharacterized protein n=1 Tax=Streptomyces aurantiogriseus TaxID=66870 RepID=A0A918F5S7_9ACTN|nr:hypothetical protein [Streptomyces aurantiogriseus]GGR10723.1 hypothetical protein GCM10010251_28370 [Streptomyces aurantiogriseus]